MNLPHFLDQLYDSGEVTVAARLTEPPADARWESATQLLERFYHEDRLNLVSKAPAFDAATALAAARMLYCGCQCLAQRKLPAAEVRAALEPRQPQPYTPANIYSADLTLRYLRDLLRLARGLAPDDVLVQSLLDNARLWPLSSVGIHELPAPPAEALAPLLHHPALLALYADRIVATRDAERLAEPVVLEAVRAALGAHAEAFWPEPPAIITGEQTP